jgi:hypothetical protein
LNNINSKVKNTAADDDFSRRVANIRRDSVGRFCFNDVHQIVGGYPSSAPSIYLELPQTQELIMAILQKDGIENHPMTGPSGADKLLFVFEELMLDYLMWISPEVRRTVFGSFSAKHDDASMAAELGQVMEQVKEDSDRARATRKH